nr:PEP-CTERM sorting domain-containing protein [Caldimonas mangrovi]
MAPVPEPETYALMLTGLGLVLWQRKRRRNASHPQA